jgi:hypothetical protein
MARPMTERIRVRVKTSISSSEGWSFSPGVYEVPAELGRLLMRNALTAVPAGDGEPLGADYACPTCGLETALAPGDAARVCAAGHYRPI